MHDLRKLGDNLWSPEPPGTDRKRNRGSSGLPIQRTGTQSRENHRQSPAPNGGSIPAAGPHGKTETTHPGSGDIRYTIDLTRGYHNLLQKEEAGRPQTYLWDGNVAAMKEDVEKKAYYYLQDELGSPVRLTDEEGKLAESYGYDEFGQDLYGNREGTAGRNITGSIQPFGYTGYQADRIAGTYYAQAREYRAETGRFDGRDIIKGFAAAPYTLNEYGYCWNNPMVLVDRDGAWPSWEDVKNVASDIFENVNNWIDNNVGITYITRIDKNYGILGEYEAISSSQADDKLIDIRIENGIPQSISLNFNAEIAGIKGSTSIGLSNNLIDMTSNIAWNYGNRDYKIGYNYSMLGVGFEWGGGENNRMYGNGFRLSVNPLDPWDFYSYSESVEGNQLLRTEKGNYINTLAAELAVVSVIGLTIVIVKTAPVLVPVIANSSMLAVLTLIIKKN